MARSFSRFAEVSERKRKRKEQEKKIVGEATGQAARIRLVQKHARVAGFCFQTAAQHGRRPVLSIESNCDENAREQHTPQFCSMLARAKAKLARKKSCCFSEKKKRLERWRRQQKPIALRQVRVLETAFSLHKHRRRDVYSIDVGREERQREHNPAFESSILGRKKRATKQCSLRSFGHSFSSFFLSCDYFTSDRLGCGGARSTPCERTHRSLRSVVYGSGRERGNARNEARAGRRQGAAKPLPLSRDLEPKK